MMPSGIGFGLSDGDAGGCEGSGIGTLDCWLIIAGDSC